MTVPATTTPASPRAARPGLRIALVSPGAMGSALARCWRAAGADVHAVLDGRSERTRALAAAAGVSPAADLATLVGAADLVVSVTPPAAAEQVARAVAHAAARAGVHPDFADLNAVAPATVARLADTLGDAGCTVIDGAISGPPPRAGGRTLLYLSGPGAGTGGGLDRLAGLSGDGLRTVVVGPEPGQASAVKMCTASVYKGFSALLTQALGTAHAHGVLELVVDDLRSQFGGQLDDAATSIALAASKAARFVGEMEQIAATQDAAGLRPELFTAMAEVWRAVARTELAAATPEQAAGADDLAAVLDALLADDRLSGDHLADDRLSGGRRAP